MKKVTFRDINSLKSRLAKFIDKADESNKVMLKAIQLMVEQCDAAWRKDGINQAEANGVCFIVFDVIGEKEKAQEYMVGEVDEAIAQ